MDGTELVAHSIGDVATTPSPSSQPPLADPRPVEPPDLAVQVELVMVMVVVMVVAAVVQLCKWCWW